MYLSGIVTSTFKVGTGFRGGRSLSSSFPPWAGVASVFPLIFCLIVNLKLFAIWSIIININHVISIIIRQTFWYYRKLSLYTNRLYIVITKSRPSALFMNVLLIFNMHKLNGVLILNTTPFCFILIFPSTQRYRVPFSTIFTSL